MSGQVWGTNNLGGFMYSDQLSEILRTELQPMVRFRQFADIKEGKGESSGDKLYWNIYSDVSVAGSETGLLETDTMPETNFTITQESLTVTEFGNSVPFTKKLDDLSKQPVTEVIQKVLKNDARITLEKAAYNKWNATLLHVVPTGGTSASAVTLSTNGTASSLNNLAMGKAHVRAIADNILAERNITPIDGENWGCIGRPSTFTQLKTDLEAVYQYVDAGYSLIYNGEIGRFEGIRFIRQTGVASQAWANAKSDPAFFFGADTVTEAIVIPEEIRGKIPTDFGRSRGVAWYYLGGFGLNFTNANDTRIVKWASQGEG